MSMSMKVHEIFVHEMSQGGPLVLDENFLWNLVISVMGLGVFGSGKSIGDICFSSFLVQCTVLVFGSKNPNLSLVHFKCFCKPTVCVSCLILDNSVHNAGMLLVKQLHSRLYAVHYCYA